MVLCVACGASTAQSPSADTTAQRGGAPELNALPLGDGNVSTSPRVGYVYSCQTTFGGNGAPAGKAPWIVGTSWDQTAKPTVQGDVMWPNSRVTISLSGAQRIVSANNLPSHATGTFPIARTDPAFQYDGNPNSISEQTILLRLNATPQTAATPTCVPQGMIGFTVSGAALYNALDAAGRDAAAHEVQDKCAGHPQGQGQYHYHSWSTCIHDAATTTQSQHSDLVGYALDGFGIFGQFGEGGKRLSNADLDACHGHTHAISWDGQTQTLYHYHMTREYPYSVGCFHGVRL
jgi:YHYH protein